MFHVHQANHQELLAARFAELLRRPQDPFVAETVVVQSQGMARWLSLACARHNGVAANLQFHFPSAYVWQVFRQVLQTVPESSEFDRSVLAWRVLGVFMGAADSMDSPVRHYLDQADARQSYQLAQRLADIFDQYLVYRPDWIRDWDAGLGSDWQSRLWHRLATTAQGPHRVQLLDALLSALERDPGEGVPERISLFGIPVLSPADLRVFEALSRWREVHLFLLNPCREYWGDIVPERRVAAQDPAGESYLETGNALLASWGGQGRDFVDMLQDLPTATDDDFVDPEVPAKTLLARIQSDILNLRNPGGASQAPVALAGLDDSLRIHDCHSPMRELEVLHDQLLAIFDSYPDINPSDVVVMAPDIEAYAPYIDAVFGTRQGDRFIPFSLSDRHAANQSPLVEAFFALLDLPHDRHAVNQVLALLDCEPVRRRFELTLEDLDRLHRWFREMGTRGALDGAERARHALPAEDRWTWREGLQRLMLGYAMPGEGRRLYAGHLPVDAVEGSDGLVVGRLAEFVAFLAEVDRALAEPKSVMAWSRLMADWLNRMFAPTEAEEDDLQLLRDALSALAEQAELARFHQPVDSAVVIAALNDRLGQAAMTGRFLSGGVTFCALLPMRSIPFSVVCLIGMDGDAYPRSHRPLSFDLMAEDFRRGDRSRRDDDRYLFLEALLSARRYLYLSYVGRDIRDNSLRPPSVLVAELLDYLARGYHLERPGDLLPQLVTRHPLQAFSRAYFSGEHPHLFSYDRELSQAGDSSQKIEASAFLDQSLPPPDADWMALDLARFIEFWLGPTTFLLRRRLDLQYDRGVEPLDSREPLVLDSLQRWQLRQHLLDLYQHGLADEDSEAVVRAAGLLPPGPLGHATFQQTAPKVAEFAQVLALASEAPAVEPLSFGLDAAGARLSGVLGELTSAGRFRYRVGTWRAQDEVRAWIEHLLLSAFAPESVQPQTYVFSESEKTDNFLWRPVDDAQARLERLLALYVEGLQRPLPFFPMSAHDYARVALGGRSDPMTAARKAWFGIPGYQTGERDNPYLRRAWGDVDPLDEEFQALAREFFFAAAEHREALP